MRLFDNPQVNKGLSEDGHDSLKEELFNHISNATSWTYDIATQSMTFEYFSDDNELIGKHVVNDYRNSINSLHVIASDDMAVFDIFCAELDAGKENIVAEFRGVGKDYQIVWFRQIGQTVFDENKKPVKVLGRRIDITREKTSGENSTTRDILTGLYHREKLRELINEAYSANPTEKVAYILIDVDDFSEVNSICGKTQGDDILQTLSGLIYTNFISKDIVGRIAGDQFMVFCSNIEEQKVMTLLDELNERIAKNVSEINGHPITVSAGVSFGPKDGSNFEILYAKADIALFEAKRTGKGRYLFFDHDSMGDVCMGYTLKKMGNFSTEETRINQFTKKVNKKLFDFAFDVMSKEPDLNTAIEEVFSEVCLYYSIDRAFVEEWAENSQKVNVSARWCKVPDGDDNYSMPVSSWNILESNIPEEGYWIFTSGRTEGIDLFREILMLKMPPVSSLVFPIVDNGALVAIVGFDCLEQYDFAPNCLVTLQSIVRLFRSYMLSRQVKQVLETEAIINKNVMDAQKVVYYIIDENTHSIKYMSKHAKALYPNAEYGKKCYESIFGKKDHCEICPLHCANAKDNSIQVYIEEEDTWYTFTATHMKDTESENDVLICVTDVTEFLAKIRSEDSLTEACSFDQFIVEATKTVFKHDKVYDVICTGIRNFSKINDEYGYVVGDAVLKAYAEFVAGMLKNEELFCRIKGDDFVLLVEHGEYDVESQLQKINKYMNERFKPDYPHMEIFSYAGCYSIGEDEKYINRCVDNAMKARRIAESEMDRNGGYYVYSVELEQKEKEEQELNDKIKTALKDNRFVVYFQPKVDIFSSEIIGAEALVRMKDEEGKMVSPGLFVPLAEKNGLIVDIDASVYEQTFSLISKWQKEGKKVPLVSVNVSRLHLLDNNLPQKFKSLSDKYGVDTNSVELEITESVFFEDTDRLIDMIKRLKELGFVISMDDFGSGYSTLNFMKTLPVDVIKIDGGFFMKNQMDNKSKAIISAIIQLTKNLEFEIVSEGVETEEQVEFLKEQGAHCVQGYYFYKPIPQEEFEKLI